MVWDSAKEIPPYPRRVLCPQLLLSVVSKAAATVRWISTLYGLHPPPPWSPEDRVECPPWFAQDKVNNLNSSARTEADCRVILRSAKGGFLLCLSFDKHRWTNWWSEGIATAPKGIESYMSPPRFETFCLNLSTPLKPAKGSAKRHSGS